MVALSRPGTRLLFDTNGNKPSYPAIAIVNVSMSPLEFFGAAALTGKLHIAPVGAKLTAKLQSFRGVGKLIVEGTYPLTDFISSFLGQNFHLTGNLATFEFNVLTEKELVDFCYQIGAIFTTIFSTASHAPIDIVEMHGEIGNCKFIVMNCLDVSNSVHVTGVDRKMNEHFDTYALRTPPPVFLSAALRYLQQSDRLATEGIHATIFLSERLLNVSKSLEAIFPGEIDAMRNKLQHMGVDSTYIEVFASVRHLRNQLDIGHVMFRELDQRAIEEVVYFSDLATSCLRSLLCRILANSDDLQYLKQSRNEERTKKLPDALNYVKRYKNILKPENGDLSILKRK